jgi:hypothetical protein
MKKYKVIQATDAASFEADINELAKAGWKVISANVANLGLKSDEARFFALMENHTIEDEIKLLLEEEATDIDNINLSPSEN